VLPTELVVRESCGCDAKSELPTEIYKKTVMSNVAVG
jgi:hypothetical protein